MLLTTEEVTGSFSVKLERLVYGSTANTMLRLFWNRE